MFKRLAASGLALCLLVPAAGCGREEKGVVKRKGQPDYITSFDEKLMDAAIAEGQSTLDEFVAALKAGKAGTANYSVKKGFKYGRDGVEFIWVSDVKLQGDDFEGAIGNKPVNAIGVAEGQTVKVLRAEAVDWMYMENGRLQGGYTVAALAWASPEREKLARQMGIDWTKYKFLQKKK